jgi:hypothetical protein
MKLALERPHFLFLLFTIFEAREGVEWHPRPRSASRHSAPFHGVPQHPCALGGRGADRGEEQHDNERSSPSKRFIVSPPEDPPLPAILAGLSRSPATSSLAERIASRAGAPATTISGALCFGGEGPGRWLIAAAAERGGDHQCQERLHAELPSLLHS